MAHPPDAGAGPREVELKLEFDPGDAERLRRHPALRRGSAGRGRTRGVRSVYYDTPDLALFRRGVALRLRDAPHGRLQTVKTLGEAAAGLFDRPEHEVALAGSEPDPDAIGDAALRAAVLEETVQRGQRLEPVVETEVRRTTRVLRQRGAELEVVVDEGEVRTKLGALPIHELELELRHGEASALFALALDVQQEVALRPALRSKPERGFAQLLGLAPQPRKARPLALTPEASVDDVLHAVVGEGLRQILGNVEAAAAGEDPEGVHQLRVGIRRLRSALALFRPVLPAEPTLRLREELRWLGGELGPARDLDVFLLERLGPLLAARADDGALKRLRDEAVAARAGAYAQARDALASPRAARLVLELGAFRAGRVWREQPLSPASARLFAPAIDFAREVLERRQRKVQARGRHLASRTPEELHALRIQLKKLRYAGDFLAPLFPRGKAKRFLRRTAGVQDVLGHLNDAAVAERLTAELLARMGPEVGPDHQRAAGFVSGWAASEARARMARLEKRWAQLAHAEPFWT